MAPRKQSLILEKLTQVLGHPTWIVGRSRPTLEVSQAVSYSIYGEKQDSTDRPRSRPCGRHAMSVAGRTLGRVGLPIPHP